MSKALGQVVLQYYLWYWYGQRNIVRAVKRREEVDAFDACSCGGVIVPANKFAGVGVRLVSDTIVHDQNRVFALHLAHQRLNDLPQVRRGVGLLRQKARDLVMADVRLQKPRQSCSGRRSKRRDQVIGVQIEQRLVHATSLPDWNYSNTAQPQCLRNISY